MTEKTGEFYNQMNWLNIVRSRSTIPSHRFCRGNIIAKKSLLCYVRNVQGYAYFIPVDIMEESVESVARKLSGSSGPGGTDSEALQGWLVKFGEDITRLSTSVEFFLNG